MLSWFDTQPEQQFVAEFVQELQRLVAPGDTQATASRKLVTKLEKLNARATQFARGRQVNVFRKAKLLNTLKWRLKELGYPQEFTDSVVNAVLGALQAA